MNKEEKRLEDRFLDALDGHTCVDCGEYKNDVTFQPCPLASEIHEDDTLMWLCDDCYYERAMEI